MWTAFGDNAIRVKYYISGAHGKKMQSKWWHHFSPAHSTLRSKPTLECQGIANSLVATNAHNVQQLKCTAATSLTNACLWLWEVTPIKRFFLKISKSRSKTTANYLVGWGARSYWLHTLKAAFRKIVSGLSCSAWLIRNNLHNERITCTMTYGNVWSNDSFDRMILSIELYFWSNDTFILSNFCVASKFTEIKGFKVFLSVEVAVGPNPHHPTAAKLEQQGTN